MINTRFLSIVLSTKKNCAKYMRHFIETGEELKIMVKADKQLYTNVDIISQAIFEKNLKHFYPEISIIGEENLQDKITKDLVNNSMSLIEKYFVTKESIELFEDKFKKVLENESKKSFITKEKTFEELIKRNRIKILLDPLDATSSLIKKDFNESTILTGVLLNNKPYLGLITSPFYNHEKEENRKEFPIVTYFNIPKNGVFSLKLSDNNGYQLEKLRSSKRDENQIESEKVSKDLKIIVSRTREEKIKSILSPLLKTNVIKNLNIRTGNGMGYRSIKMLEEGYYFITERSTFGFWDLCAPDALFREIGGGCYCLNEDPINYTNAASKENHKYDIIIGDSKSSINYYLQHYKSLNKL